MKSYRSLTTPSLTLGSCRGGLVDLLVTGSRVRRAHRDVGADLLELKVVSLGAVLDEVDHVLGVTGVAGTLDAHTLGGVIALLGSLEGLIELAALTFLLLLLADLGYGRDRGHGQHRQKRRQDR